MKYDVITFGAASRDIFLRSKQFLVGDFKPDKIKKEILLPAGLKINIEEIHFHSGGGGTNAAATFSAQGFKTAYCGLLGQDPEGEAVLKELKEKKIRTELILKTDRRPTNLSVIFSTPQERTILVYRGASQFLGSKQISWSKIKKTKWFYLAPLTEKLTGIFEPLLDFARKNKIKVMANPGSSQLKLSLKALIPLLSKIDILALNQEEGQLLAKDDRLRGEKLVGQIRKVFPGILILTDGENKSLVSDGHYLFEVPSFRVKVLDKTGAGDAFAAGFLAGYLKSKGNIVSASQLAAANAAACLSKWGAKEGILRKGQRFKKVKVRKK